MAKKIALGARPSFARLAEEHYGDRELAAALAGYNGIRDAKTELDLERLFGLILDHERQLHSVTEVQEARWGGSKHHGLAGGDARVGVSELLVAGDGDRHDPVAGQRVG